MAYVYLIHFSKPIGNANHTAQHYIGYTSIGLGERLQQHVNGYGAKICRHAALLGIDLKLVRYWSNGTRSLERKLKNRKNAKFLCPICNPKIKFKMRVKIND